MSRLTNEESPSSFSLPRQFLIDLFDLDSIRDFTSLQKLFSLTSPSLLSHLCTDLISGISEASLIELSQRRSFYGKNESFQRDPKSL